MANPEHLKILKQGIGAWNEWRKKNPDIEPDLREADLAGAVLIGADLTGATLRDANLWQSHLENSRLVGANLRDAYLRFADLESADLTNADLSFAILRAANLMNATFDGAILVSADLTVAQLDSAKLTRANLRDATFMGANMTNAILVEADLSGADLRGADLTGSDLTRAVLDSACLVRTCLRKTILNSCLVYGISAWDVKLDSETKQESLVITPGENDQEITVDSLEIAQFLYLVLNNEKLGHFIRVMRTSAVLILGSFSKPSKDFLEALRAGVRAKGLVPIIYDFDTSVSSSHIENVQTLALLSKFVIVDLSEPAGQLLEIGKLIPDTYVPFVMIARAGSHVTRMRLHHGYWFNKEYIPYPPDIEEAKAYVPDLIKNKILPLAEEINAQLYEERKYFRAIEERSRSGGDNTTDSI